MTRTAETVPIACEVPFPQPRMSIAMTNDVNHGDKAWRHMAAMGSVGAFVGTLKLFLSLVFDTARLDRVYGWPPSRWRVMS